METALPLIWALLLATGVFLYVVMDGFDLGVGILFPANHGKEERDIMVNTVAPVWDGNETWLVLGGGGLLAVFPPAYAIIMPALYAPVIVMLLALVFRGVSFEMRFKAETPGARLWWDRAFSWGSYIAAFSQGITLGALVQGIQVQDGAYAGGWWDWLTPFSLLTGVAVVVGYGLLGACWLVWKTGGPLQSRAIGLARGLGAGTLLMILLVSFIMPFLQPAFADRWLTFPNIVFASPVPILLAILAWRFFKALSDAERRAAGGTDERTAWQQPTPWPQTPQQAAAGARSGQPETKAEPTVRPSPFGRTEVWRDGAPFFYALGFFLLSYIGLGISMWPLVVPPTVTIWDAAAPSSTQLFLLVGAAVLIPVILIYTGYVYWIFRGKVRPGEGYH